MMFKPVLSLFENWIKPYDRKGDLTPPRALWPFIWFYVSQAKWPFFAMLVLGGFVAMLEAGLFYFVGRLVDMLGTVSKADGWHGLWAAHGFELGLMLFVVLVVRFLAAALSALVEEQTIVVGYYTMSRWQAYAHVARQSVSFFQNDFSGRIVTKVLAAGQATGDLMVALLQNVWFIVIYTVSTLVLFAQVDWHLSAIVVVWIVGFLLISRHFVPRIRKLSRASAEANSALNGRIVDAYANIQTLKLFGREEDSDNYVKAGFQRVNDTVKTFVRHVTGVRSALSMLSGVMIAAIAGFSIHLWFLDQISAGGVAVTLGLVLRLNMLLGRMMTHFNSVMRNIGTIQNSAEMLAEPIRLLDRPDATVLKPKDTEIRFSDVTFHYGRGAGVLEKLNLTIRPGEKVGIVGRSGAGKSTLVNLLLRFHDVEGGSITIGGEDISAVTQHSLRSQIGMVTQDTALLHRSIRDNILFGRTDATDEQLMHAIRMAEADQFIETLQDQMGRKGLDAHVGERGVKLSGGQRQRIAIARVLLKDAPILVLDEATSALDSEVEAAIQGNLERLMQGKTVLAIAHRLSTIAALDRLVVMDQGRIIEEGTHARLVAAGGLYSELWARQSGGFIAVDEAAE